MGYFLLYVALTIVLFSALRAHVQLHWFWSLTSGMSVAGAVTLAYSHLVHERRRSVSGAPCVLFPLLLVTPTCLGLAVAGLRWYLAIPLGLFGALIIGLLIGWLVAPRAWHVQQEATGNRRSLQKKFDSIGQPSAAVRNRAVKKGSFGAPQSEHRKIQDEIAFLAGFSGLLHALEKDAFNAEATQLAEDSGEPAIKALIERFDIGYDEGNVASAALARIGAPAVPLLIEALRNREGYKFAWACETLERIGRPAIAAIPVLEEIARDPTRITTQREEASESVAKLRRA